QAKQERMEARRAKEAQRQKAQKKATERREEEEKGVRGPTAEAFEGFTGVAKSNFSTAYFLCAQFPPAQIAREFHTDNDIADIAAAYAEGYTEPSRVAAEEGCLAGFIDSPEQRKAAFKMMEAAEK